MRRPRFEENKAFYAAIGRRIAKARVGRTTQEDLAKKTALTRTSIVNIEKGRQQILVHTLVDIARALRVQISELVPPGDTLEEVLRDKPRRGLEWIRSSTEQTKK